MKRKTIATILVCGLCVSMLSACGEEESSSSRREKKSNKSKTESSKELDEVFNELGELFGKGEHKPAARPEPTETVEEDYNQPDEDYVADTQPLDPDGTGDIESEAWDPVYEEEPGIVEDEQDDPFVPLVDPYTGKPYDLGGMEIIVRNWMAPEEPDPPHSAYEESRYEWRQWAMETYNFTIKELPIGDWYSAPQDFSDYVYNGGDDNCYVFMVREDELTAEALKNGLMYDLASFDCLDFTESKFTNNKIHELYGKNEKIYAMNAGFAEPGVGMWFNKRILTEAGIDPESIYDMQAAGTWTWEAWTDIMAKVQRDIDNDGVTDIYGMDADYSTAVCQAVYSNDAEFVGKDEYGKYVYEFENPETVEALEWIVDVFNDYGMERPEYASWNYCNEAFLNGQVAFLPAEAYIGYPGSMLESMVDEIGFVMFPKGPNADDYVNCWNNNAFVIPDCYDAEKAWKIAFAWNLYTDEVPGYEGYMELTNYVAGFFDDRAVEETIIPMMNKGMVTYHTMISWIDMENEFLYEFGRNMNMKVSDILDKNRNSFNLSIEHANQ